MARTVQYILLTILGITFALVVATTASNYITAAFGSTMNVLPA